MMAGEEEEKEEAWLSLTLCLFRINFESGPLTDVPLSQGEGKYRKEVRYRKRTCRTMSLLARFWPIRVCTANSGRWSATCPVAEVLSVSALQRKEVPDQGRETGGQ